MPEDSGLHFLSLPLEIREQIYTELLLFENNRIDYEDDYNELYPDDEPPDVMVGDMEISRPSRLAIDLRIYRVNKRIHEEAKKVFRRINTFVCIQSPFRDAERNMEERARCLIVCSGRTADSFNQCQMHCVIDAPGMPIREDCRFIIGLQDLERFCQMWKYFDLHHQSQLNSHLTVNLVLSSELPKQLQQRLLNPFVSVKSLGGFTITGPHSLDLETSIRETMKEPYATPTACLNECSRLKDAGNIALKGGHPERALKLYTEAFSAMHIIIEGRKRNVWADSMFETHIGEGPFQGQWGGLARTILRIHLVANTMMAYLRLGKYSEAYFWGKRSINIMRHSFPQAAERPQNGFPAASSCGKIYYRAAVAARALGKTATARELVSVASRWLPDDPIVQKDNAIWGVAMLGL